MHAKHCCFANLNVLRFALVADAVVVALPPFCFKTLQTPIATVLHSLKINLP